MEFTCVFAKEKPIPVGIGIGPSPHTSHLSLLWPLNRAVRRRGVSRTIVVKLSAHLSMVNQQYITHFGSI